MGAPEDSGAERPLELTVVANDIGAVGGMERQISALLLGLRRRGHRVSVVARTCGLPPDAGVTFHRVPGPSRPFLIAYPWFLLAGSVILARRRRGLVQATGAVVLNPVDVVTIHYFHRVGPATPSRSNLLYRLHVRIAGVVKRLGERMCLRPGHVRSVVCVSEGVEEEVLAYYPRLTGIVEAIHNGVDTDAFAPGLRPQEAAALRERLQIAPGELVLAFVGSEWDRKGLAAAVRALAAAPGWTLVVAGQGDEAGYRELAAREGVGERVRWLGVSSDVQLVYELADAFVLPSAYETFSLVTFEAAACGLPILAAPVSGVRELIDDGRNGYLIGQDPALIAARLRDLASDPSLRERLGAAARESALGFSNDRMVERHVELYRRLTGT
jgi:glycosyltransferase involved in cell wall biosynthesis